MNFESSGVEKPKEKKSERYNIIQERKKKTQTINGPWPTVFFSPICTTPSSLVSSSGAFNYNDPTNGMWATFFPKKKKGPFSNLIPKCEKGE